MACSSNGIHVSNVYYQGLWLLVARLSVAWFKGSTFKGASRLNNSRYGLKV